MDFAFSEDQLMLRDSTRDLVKENFALSANDEDKDRSLNPETLKSLKDLGYLGICTPNESGGAGFDTLSLVIVLEEIASYDASAALLVSGMNSLSIGGLLPHSDQNVVRDYLSRVSNGDLIGAVAINESDDSYSHHANRTRASLRGNNYVLNGFKAHVLDAELADFFIVSARTGDDEGEISLFILDKNTPGLKIESIPRMMGNNAAAIGNIRLDDCSVPLLNLVGKEGGGLASAQTVLQLNQLGLAAIAVGISAGSLRESIDYSKVRTQFDQPLCEFEAIQFMLADMSTSIDAARLLVYKAAVAFDQHSDYAELICAAKLFASETAFKNVHHANQIFGGYGYIKEYAVERLFREQLFTELFAQNNDTLRLHISKRLLG
ncbi:acyl-CoA dehydrogenase family protein [candidate division KSB1 bacterium]|nr:acyl-CoA dehydrogenase family protein [candidate division KSB1 bacterium]